MAVVTFTLLENVGNGRDNAFYNVYTIGNRVITAFGKRGSEGRYDVQGAANESQAGVKARAIVTKKETQSASYTPVSAGSFEVDSGEFDRLLLAQGNKAAGLWLNSQRLRNRAAANPRLAPQAPRFHPTDPVPTGPPDAPAFSLDAALSQLEARIKDAMTLAATDSLNPQVLTEHTTLLAVVTDVQKRADRLNDYLGALETLIPF